MKGFLLIAAAVAGFMALMVMAEDGGVAGYTTRIHRQKADMVERRVWSGLADRAVRVDDTMARVERRLYQSGDQEAIGDWEGMSHYERRKFAAHLERRGW